MSLIYYYHSDCLKNTAVKGKLIPFFDKDESLIIREKESLADRKVNLIKGSIHFYMTLNLVIVARNISL